MPNLARVAYMPVCIDSLLHDDVSQRVAESVVLFVELE
jgi:hypothetical protein